MRQAHCEGVVDFAAARPLDRRWQRKLQWSLDWLEEKNLRELWRTLHELHAGAVTYLAGDEPLKLHWQQAIALETRLQQSLFPWFKQTSLQDAAASMTDSWERAYGKMNDPEVQARIKKAAEAMQARTQRNMQSRQGSGRRSRLTAGREPGRRPSRVN